MTAKRICLTLLCLLLGLVTGHCLHAELLDVDRAQAYLIQWEGYRLTPYQDRDCVSVGIGHNLTINHEPIRLRYTPAECRAFFLRDYIIAISACRSGITDFDTLPLDVQELVLGLVWCCGSNGFLRFTDLRRSLSRRAYNAAATALYLSLWFQQVSPQRANAALAVLRSY